MPTEISPTRRTAAADHTWIRDRSGLTSTQGVTLDGDLFGSLRFPDGAVPGGTVVAKVTSGPSAGLWGPYDPAATDGRQTAELGRIAHVLDACTVGPGRRVTTSALDSVGVFAPKLPTPPNGGAVGVVSDAVRTALAGRMRYDDDGRNVFGGNDYDGRRVVGADD